MFFLLFWSMLGPVRTAHREVGGCDPPQAMSVQAPLTLHDPKVSPNVQGRNYLEVSSLPYFPRSLTSSGKTGFSTLTSVR